MTSHLRKPLGSTVAVCAAFAIAATALIAGCGSRKQGIPKVEYEYVILSKMSENCPNLDSACASIYIEYPKILSSPNPSVTDTLNAFVQALLLGGYESSGVGSLDDLMQQFVGAYDDFRADVSDYWIPWYTQRSIDIVGDTAGIVSFSFTIEEYTGGAHSNSARLFDNFDALTGRRVSLADVLVDRYEADLTAVAEVEFRQTYDLDAAVDLGDAGFWFEEGRFRLNDNYSIGNDGITFHYNAYEIAPYVTGPTELVIPYSLIADLIDPNGLLAR